MWQGGGDIHGDILKKEKKEEQGALWLVPVTLHERFTTEAALPHSLMSSHWWEPTMLLSAVPQPPDTSRIVNLSSICVAASSLCTSIAFHDI